jgi:hypothetical protein
MIHAVIAVLRSLRFIERSNDSINHSSDKPQTPKHRNDSMNHFSDKPQSPKHRNDSMNHHLMNLKLLNTEMTA